MVVGGVGVAGVSSQVAEYAAFQGAIGAGFVPTPAAPGVILDSTESNCRSSEQTTAPDGIASSERSGGLTLVGPIDSLRSRA